MQDWDLIGKNILLFVVDGIFGYFFQFMGHAIAIHTFNKRQIKPKSFLLMTVIFAVSAYLIRLLPIVFGYHTILNMIVCIVVSVLVFKTAIYPTVLAVLLTIVSILIFEMVNYGLLSLFMGSSTVDGYLAVENSVLKSIMGIPTNIFLIIEMIILYKVLPKKLLKGGFNGRDSQKFS